MENSDLIIKTNQRLDKLSKQLYVQSKSYDEIISMAKNKEKMLSSIPAIMPVSNKDLTRTASGYGWRIHPIYKIRKFHEGMDFTAPTGTEVYATGDGIIEVVKSSKRGYGKRVVIDHGFGYKTRYAHLNEFNVRRGQEVKRGEVIGYVGSSGLSVAPHLHYEVMKGNKNVNPVDYYFNDLTPKQYEKMIFISSNSGQSLD
jgi:murein DD-endopeptidase MepM/ murein hydrolase activator NlpD